MTDFKEEIIRNATIINPLRKQISFIFQFPASQRISPMKIKMVKLFPYFAKLEG